MIYVVFTNAGMLVTDIVQARIDMGATSSPVEIGIVRCPLALVALSPWFDRAEEVPCMRAVLLVLLFVLAALPARAQSSSQPGCGAPTPAATPAQINGPQAYFYG